jgi:hypothetical protein
VEPPASAYPRLADGTAVMAESLAESFGKIPGVRFPDRIARPRHLDLGPDIERGIAAHPPKAGRRTGPTSRPCDGDCNEVAGIRSWEVAAPLATLTGWNPRHPDQGSPGDLMAMMGSTLPFPAHASERERTAIAQVDRERYGSRAAYLEKVREVTQS